MVIVLKMLVCETLAGLYCVEFVARLARQLQYSQVRSASGVEGGKDRRKRLMMSFATTLVIARSSHAGLLNTKIAQGVLTTSDALKGCAHKIEKMVKFAALSVALLAGSASAFTTSTASSRAGSVTLSAEKSKSLPWLNRPALVSDFATSFALNAVC